MERYSNIPVTKLAVVKPPSEGFPGIRPYGIAGILSYLKTVIHEHIRIDPNEEWQESSNRPRHNLGAYYLELPGDWQRIYADVVSHPEDEVISVSLSFPRTFEAQRTEEIAVENIRQDLSKNKSVTNIRTRFHHIQFDITGVSIPEDDEDFFNLPPQNYPFEYGNPVPASRHRNPDRSLGGWVAESAYVLPDVYLGPNAKVFGEAEVSGNVRVLGNAEIFGRASVSSSRIETPDDGVTISGNARVSGNAQIYENAQIYDNAQVSGNAEISGGSIYGEAQISGTAYISGGYISGNTEISGDTFIRSDDVNITSGKITGGVYPPIPEGQDWL
jgi:carbonic anhydrase/acetyltransferase-like protein (isoleucine patch superfamily)